MARCDRNLKQENIPGGCIFPFRWPPLDVSNRGVPSRGGSVSSGRCAFQGRGCTFPGGVPSMYSIPVPWYTHPSIPTPCYKHPCPLSGIPQRWYISDPPYSNLLVYPPPLYTHHSLLYPTTEGTWDQGYPPHQCTHPSIPTCALCLVYLHPWYIHPNILTLWYTHHPFP